jgi:hypothetical protein
MRTLVNLRFEKGDPVCEYWLARGTGFVVETRNGRVVGEVLDSVFDPERQRVVGLVIRERMLGAVPGPTSEVPADRIAAAVPGREAFVLDGAPEREPEQRQRRLAPAARAAGSGAAGAARAAGNGAAGAARRIGPIGGRLAAWGRAAVPMLSAIAATIAAWAVGFAAWLVLAARALAAEARRSAGELRRRWSPPQQ